jgi:type I restriction enzyme S subunit
MTDRPSFTNQQINSVIADETRHDPFFVYYLLQTRVEHLKAIAGGAATPIINKTAFSEIEVSVPPLPVQRRIAGILSAYDELMENSQRRIRLLEAMARALYREWFVHFRFPGHEKHPRVASPLGDIPQGWEVCALGDLVQFKSGFAFKSGTFTADGEHRLVTIRNVQDGAFNPESDSRMSELPANLPPYCVLEDGDILLSLTGNVGRVCLVYDGPFLLNQRVSKLAPVEAFDWAMTYCMFRESEMRVKLEQLSNGVAQQNLSPVLASKMDFARPPRELRQQFATLAEPMVRRIVQLYTTIQNLRRTRDLLLPRLLSGQVELKTN